MSDIASDLFLIGSEIPWETIDDKVSRQIVGFNDSIMMVKVKFKEGGIGPVHDHYHSQVTYVVSGAFEMNIDGEIRLIKGGDSFYIPPHVSHGAVCKEEGMLIDVFSPHREDFLSK
jgi:quercetin dioxygenase-like cupin family protein